MRAPRGPSGVLVPRIPLLWLFLACVSCEAGSPADTSDARAPCTNDTECLAGWHCRVELPEDERYCVPPGWTAESDCVPQCVGSSCNPALCGLWYLDGDGDGFGVAASWRCRCDAEGDYRTRQAGDCDDTNPQVHPEVVETCNGKDDDCNGNTDDGSLCDDGIECTLDSCQGESGCGFEVTSGWCLIDGTCHHDGQPNPDDPCLACQAASNSEGWSPAPDGRPCGTGRCEGNLFITSGSCRDGTCAQKGSQELCDDGIGCTDDSCDPFRGCAYELPDDMCVIDRVCYQEGDIDLKNPCRFCKPSTDEKNWASAPDWVPCGINGLCRNGSCFECPDAFIPIAPSPFEIGSKANEPGRNADEDAFTPVTLRNGFCMKRTEVTQAEWELVMGFDNNPSRARTCDGGDGTDCPVENVNWWEAISFCNQLSRDARPSLPECYALADCTGTLGTLNDAERLSCETVNVARTPCRGFRLPSEAEWEYAIRAGSTTSTYNGPLASDKFQCEQPNPVLDPIAWFCGNSNGHPHPVGTRQPNDLGLHDMAGNVREWTEDCWHPSYFGVPQDGLSWQAGCPVNCDRVVRGGDWSGFARFGRSANRYGSPPATRSGAIGIRPVLTIP